MKILYMHEDTRTPGEGKGGGAETIVHAHMDAMRQAGYEVGWWHGQTSIARMVDTFRPDVVEVVTIHCSNGIEPALYVQERGIPSAWWLMDYWPFCASRMLLRTKDEGCAAATGTCDMDCEAQPRPTAEYKAAVNGATKVVSLNPNTSAIYRRHGIRVDADMAPGVDTEFFSPEGEREPVRIITSSAWPGYPTKGMHILRAALNITGYKAKLVTGAPRLTLRDELRKSEIFVFPSCYQETYGLCLTEAMATGLACVASDVAGARAQIEDGVNGLLVETRNPLALAEALTRLVNDADLRATLGRNARAWALETANLKRVNERYVAWYEEVIADAKRAV